MEISIIIDDLILGDHFKMGAGDFSECSQTNIRYFIVEVETISASQTTVYDTVEKFHFYVEKLYRISYKKLRLLYHRCLLINKQKLSR